MDNLDYLKKINETEKEADEIIARARLLREENEKQARIDAEKIIETAEKSGEMFYKVEIEKAKQEGDQLLSEAKIKALTEASMIEKQSASKLDEAIKNVSEGIVRICVDS